MTIFFSRLLPAVNLTPVPGSGPSQTRSLAPSPHSPWVVPQLTVALSASQILPWTYQTSLSPFAGASVRMEKFLKVMHTRHALKPSC